MLHENLCLITSEQKLLYDIRNLLIEQNELLKGLNKPVEPVSQSSNEIILEKENNAPECKLCGGVHDNVGSKLACAKKNKKNGGK